MAVQIIIKISVLVLLVGLVFLFLKRERKTKNSIIVCLSVLTVLLAGYVTVTMLCEGAANSDLIHVCSMEAVIAMTFAAAWIDFKEKRIPNSVSLAGLIIRIAALTAYLITDMEKLVSCAKSDISAVLIIAVFCGICRLIIKSGMGMGDVKFLLVLGLFLGTEGAFSMLFVALVAAFFEAIFLLITKKAGMKTMIPFAPALFVGTLLTVVLESL